MIIEDDASTQVLQFYIGDTETCGLPPHHYPCEIGLIKIDPLTFDSLWENVSLIDPEYPIHPKALEVHGITQEMVANEPTLAEYVEHRLDGGLKGDIVMIAHNFQFDKPALSKLGNIVHGVCTLLESRQVFTQKECPGLENHKLGTLAAYFNFPPSKAHSALGDCETTRHLIKKLVEVSGRSLASMARLTDRTVHEMPWGKHKGTLLHLVPAQYIRWLFDQPGELEPNLRKSLQKVLDLK
jgi:DNA polymerase III epsilon subunit-like protein